MMRGLVIASVLAAGCAAGRATLHDPHEGQLALTVHNETGTPVCAVYLFPTSGTDPGANWLPADTEIPSGGTHAFYVPWHDPADTYQLEAKGCPYEQRQVSGYAPSVMMNVAAHAVLFDETNPQSKDTATQLVHEHENTTLVAAKFTKLAHPAPRPARVVAPRGR